MTPTVTEHHPSEQLEAELGRRADAEELCLLLAAPYYRCPAQDDLSPQPDSRRPRH